MRLFAAAVGGFTSAAASFSGNTSACPRKESSGFSAHFIRKFLPLKYGSGFAAAAAARRSARGSFLNFCMAGCRHTTRTRQNFICPFAESTTVTCSRASFARKYSGTLDGFDCGSSMWY